MPRVHRQRLVNAIVFFAKGSRHCGKIKLFKLLYLLDFEHFRQTGKSVTGYEYQAWKFGPVPVELMEEWEELGDDLAHAVHIEQEKVIDYERSSVRVNDGVEFDPQHFSPRQLRLMDDLVERFRDDYSGRMIDVTHEQNGAWDKVWQQGAGAQKAIPYQLAIGDESPHRAELLEIADEQRMYDDALRLARRHREH